MKPGQHGIYITKQEQHSQSPMCTRIGRKSRTNRGKKSPSENHPILFFHIFFSPNSFFWCCDLRGQPETTTDFVSSERNMRKHATKFRDIRFSIFQGEEGYSSYSERLEHASTSLCPDIKKQLRELQWTFSSLHRKQGRLCINASLIKFLYPC